MMNDVRFTRRQAEYATCIEEGLTRSQIARKFGRSVQAVENMRTNLRNLLLLASDDNLRDALIKRRRRIDNSSI